MTIDQLFDRMGHAPFGAADPNVTQHQAAIGDGNIQPAAFLANVPASVIIDDTGLAITDGALTVTNAGSVVIIDGTSNMLKIAASGTMQTASFTAPGNSQTYVDLELGVSAASFFHYAAQRTAGTGAYSGLWMPFSASTGHVLESFGVNLEVPSGTTTRVTAFTVSSGSGTWAARTYRYFVMKEAAF